MAYVIYEDDARDRARIHLDTCPHYINRKPIRLPDNRWHDPLDSLGSAWAKVRDTRKSDVGECKTCLR